MKVIFLKDYQHVGKRGEVKEIKDGFARNFLIPNGIAVLADPAHMGKLKHEQKAHLEQREAERKKALEIKAKLEGLLLKAKLKSREKGEPFGSISANDIVNLLKEKGIEIEKKRLLLQKPLKTFGMHAININLGDNINKILIEISLDIQTKF